MGKQSGVIVVKVGGVSVRIYTYSNQGYRVYELHFYSGGTRRRKKVYGSEAQAREEARKIAQAIGDGNAGALAFSAEDAHAFRQASELVKPTGKLLVQAAAEYAEAAQQLAAVGADLRDAVRFYLERHAAKSKPVPEIVEEFLAAKRQDGISEGHLGSLACRLRSWAEAFPVSIHEITGENLDAWLRAGQIQNDWEPQTRNHVRAAISNVCGFAKDRGYLPAKWNELAKVSVAKVVPGEVQVFAPEQARALLEAAATHRPNLVPYLALALFAGIRHAEIERLDWRDVYFEHDQVFIGKGKVNARQRLAPMVPNCKAWLLGYRQEAGPICDLADIAHALISLGELAGVEWIHNGPRHCFISFRLALTRDIAQVAEECGNSPRVIRTRYARPVVPSQAQEFFNIRPSGLVVSAPNVTELAAVAGWLIRARAAQPETGRCAYGI